MPTAFTDPMTVKSEARLDRCYSGKECAWDLFYKPRWERANFATRYHLAYPACLLHPHQEGPIVGPTTATAARHHVPWPA